MLNLKCKLQKQWGKLRTAIPWKPPLWFNKILLFFHFECSTYSLVICISKSFPELHCTSFYFGMLVFSSPIYLFCLLMDINVNSFFDWDIQIGKCELNIGEKIWYLGCQLITIQVVICCWPSGFAILIHSLPHSRGHMLVKNSYTYFQSFILIYNGMATFKAVHVLLSCTAIHLIFTKICMVNIHWNFQGLSWSLCPRH